MFRSLLPLLAAVLGVTDGVPHHGAWMDPNHYIGARSIHVLACILLFAVYRTEPAFGPIFLAATILVAVLLLFEHATVHRWGTTRMALTFMTINGIVSILVGTAGSVELLQAAG